AVEGRVRIVVRMKADGVRIFVIQFPRITDGRDDKVVFLRSGVLMPFADASLHVSGIVADASVGFGVIPVIGVTRPGLVEDDFGARAAGLDAVVKAGCTLEKIVAHVLELLGHGGFLTMRL